jgi:hypothetical protein
MVDYFENFKYQKLYWSWKLFGFYLLVEKYRNFFIEFLLAWVTIKTGDHSHHRKSLCQKPTHKIFRLVCKNYLMKWLSEIYSAITSSTYSVFTYGIKPPRQCGWGLTPTVIFRLGQNRFWKLVEFLIMLPIPGNSICKKWFCGGLQVSEF